MAIDRIGKGAGLPATPETTGAGTAAPTGAPFKVDRPDAAGPATPVTPAASDASAGRAARAGQAGGVEATSPLERFRAGEVDVDGYIDLEVDKATSALNGLSVAELDEIKSVLRDQMKSDPGLADLVRTATGKLPTPTED
jgi:hypothetical protein